MAAENTHRRELIKQLIAKRKLASGPSQATRVARGTGPLPLSSNQRQMWLHSRLAPEIPLYNDPFTIHRNGPLDPECLTRSLNQVIRRHEILRTIFPMVNGEPVQVVQPDLEIAVATGDVSSEAEALELATSDARRTFDLTTGPLIRARALRIQDENYRIYLTLHHIIFDGVSIYHVLLPELATIYEAFSRGEPSPLPPPTSQYADYTLWQREHLGEQGPAGQLAYWTARLRADRPRSTLPADRPRPAYPSFPGKLYAFKLDQDLAERLKQLARECGASLYMVLLSAFNVLLQRWSGGDDIVTGTVTAGRNRPEFAKTFGFFLNPLVLRVNAGDGCTFRELVTRVRRVVLETLDNSEVPFEFLARSLDRNREPGRNPFFDVLFSLEPPSGKPPEGWDLTQTRVDIGLSKFDLSLEFDERVDGLDGRLVYNTDLFEPETIERLCCTLNALLESVVQNPDQLCATVGHRMSSTRPVDRPRRWGVELLTQTEQEIAGIWTDLLGYPGPVDAEDSFFELGGHSLLLARLEHILVQRFGVKLDIREFYACPTIGHIAVQLERCIALQ